MMRAVEALRLRVPGTSGEGSNYAPLEPSDSGDEGEEGFEMVEMLGEGERNADDDCYAVERRGRRGRRARGLTPHYTPRYSNLKVLRRKQLDASLTYGRAGPCEHLSGTF